MLGDQLEDGAAYHLFSGVAEDARGSFVPTGDDAVEVFAENHVVGRADDCCQFADVLCGFAKAFVAAANVCDVSDGAEDFPLGCFGLRLKLADDFNETRFAIAQMNVTVKEERLALF